MAHNLNEVNGRTSMFATKTAWHGLGQIVTDAQTSEEAIKLAGLDYNVNKSKIYTLNREGGQIEIPRQFATVREDTGDALGVVGNKYTILQNKDAFKFIDELVGKKEAIFESAGALGKGERIWVSCKLPNEMVVGKNDAAHQYFFITNSHDGSKVVEIAFTDVFIVCENTLRMALNGNKNKARVRHTVSMNTSMMSAANLLGITAKQREQKQLVIEALREVKITDKQLRKFIELAMNPAVEQISGDDFSTRFTNIVDDVMEYSLGNPAQLIEERKGNLWGAINGVNGFYNNVQSYKTGEKKLTSLMWGTGMQRTQSAYDLASNVAFNGFDLNA